MFGVALSIDSHDMEVNLHMMGIDLHVENIWENQFIQAMVQKSKLF
jgi:hypothetical protein